MEAGKKEQGAEGGEKNRNARKLLKNGISSSTHVQQEI